MTAAEPADRIEANYAIRHGREFGCDIAGLQTSPMGRPVDERMGFWLVSPYREYRRSAPTPAPATGPP
jgi:hypothetical protein